MNKFIDFKPQDVILPTFVRFSITNSAFIKMSQQAKDAITMLKDLSATKILVITKGREQESYDIFTNDGIYFCKISDDNNSLVIIGFNVNTLNKQNNAMKNGICFRVSKGVIVQMKLSSYNINYDIVNGARYNGDKSRSADVTKSIAIIQQQVALANSYDEEEDFVDEKYCPERKLVNLLQLAENYSILSSELEEKKANEIGNVPYISINSIEYDRVDRVAYRFGVSKLDENIFKIGVQVEIEDKFQEKHAAEIINLIKKDTDSPATAIDLLFNEHIGMDFFNSSGWFNLSFSSVNKDVQLAANEKIKTGEAAAKYMDVVIGKSSTNGFDNKDIEDVKTKLLAKKFPPNESQMNAIFTGIKAKDVFLVMGPPGTGKTTVILEWVKYFVKNEHKRVLVSSQNNKAVDNVLARIADEKDIDIIRIGSEAKLQSEVIPYMFENKVKALREHIVKNTEKHIEAVDEVIKGWSGYLAKLDNAIFLSNEVVKSRLQFHDVIKNEFVPIYNKLDELLNECAKVKENKRKSTNKINGLYNKLLNYENSTNKIIKMATSLFYKINLKKIKAEKHTYDTLKIREQLLVDQYNAESSNYLQVYDALRDVDIKPLYKNMLDKIDAMTVLHKKPDKTIGDIWGLFDAARKFDISSDAECETLRALIDNELKRTLLLHDSLSTWKSETESKQNYALNEIVLESVDLVGATCIGINSQKRFANLDFDITIIDEAGQIQVHNALVPMSVSNKLIMLGDHKQIPPTADQELLELCEENGVNTELLEKSLFEKMYNDLPESNKIMLDTQYRMPSEIADTISEWFYDGKYFSPEFKRGVKSQISLLSNEPYVIIDTSEEHKRFEKKIEGAGSSNELEAQVVSDIIKYISQESELNEIGVISAYKSQVKLIKNKLAKFLSQDVVAEMVATLDSYQGQERDIILYSFTKSSDSASNFRRIGFLNELRRLNVAMTRCKKMLILIGDMSFLGGCQHMDIDENGYGIYDKSEKQFSDFINKMVNDVKNGRGEIITYKEFKSRINGVTING